MTNMQPMTYEEFTDLNIASNLTDFVLYLQDRNVVHFAPHVNKFGNSVLDIVSATLYDWREVAREELKERNEYIEQFSQDTCSICRESIEKDRARQNTDEEREGYIKYDK